MFRSRKNAKEKQGRLPERRPQPVSLPDTLTAKERKQAEEVIRKAKRNKGVPETVQQSIPFDRIWKDGIIRVTEGYYTKMVEYGDINYRLSSEEDRKSILEAWSGFLNFFDSSIHFEFSFLNTVTDKALFAKKIRVPMAGDGFDDLRQEYNGMLAVQLKKGNNGFTKRKFLTFGICAESLKAAVPRLNHIETDLINNFRQLGVDARILDGKERLEVMHGMFHVIDPERFYFDWKWIPQSGRSVKDFIAPSSLNFTPKNSMEVGSTYCAASYLQIGAAQIPDGLLKDILDMENGQIVTLHVRSIDQNEAIKMIKHMITEIDRSKIEEQKKAVRAGYDMDIIPSDITTFGRDFKSLLEQVQSQDQRLFMVTFLILTTGKTKQELDNNMLQLSSTAQKYSCGIIRLDYQQEQGLMSSLPLAWNAVDIERALTTSSLAINVPFTTQELFQEGREAIYSGLNALTGNMIFLDRKRLKTPNGLILGTPGSGKSFTTKREIYSVFLSTQDDIIICDPESEYAPLVESLKGQVIHISPASPQFINPMDINSNYSEEDNPVALKSDFILSFCELILGDKDGLQPVEKTVIDRCVHTIYARYFMDPRPENMPVLEDLYNELLAQKEGEAERVATALELYVNGSLNVFNHRTNVDVSNRVVCYDIRDLGKQLKKLGMIIVQDQVWNRVTMNRYKKKTTRYFIDEMHLLLREEQTAAYTVEIWKRFRKWGGIPTGITQNIKDLLASREVENIFENSEYICMLNQAAEDRQILAQHLGISPNQLKYVTRVGEGQGLIFYGSLILPFVDHFPRDTKMYRIMTTKLAESIDGNAEGADAEVFLADDGNVSAIKMDVVDAKSASPAGKSNAASEENEGAESVGKSTSSTSIRKTASRKTTAKRTTAKKTSAAGTKKVTDSKKTAATKKTTAKKTTAKKTAGTSTGTKKTALTTAGTKKAAPAKRTTGTASGKTTAKKATTGKTAVKKTAIRKTSAKLVPPPEVEELAKDSEVKPKRRGRRTKAEIEAAKAAEMEALKKLEA